jgi:serine/threonine protein kinase
MDLTKILKDLHTQIKFAHRDIKQNNVMFKDGLVYLIDFGLAQELPTDSSPL